MAVDRCGVYTMSYADWLRQEAATQRSTTEDLAARLQINPLCIEEYGFFSRSNATDRLHRCCEELYVVTDFRECETEQCTIFGIRLSSAYVMRGTAVRIAGKADY